MAVPPWLDAAAILLLGALLLVPGLGGYPLWDPDEGRHAQVAREMALAGEWLVPRVYGAPYYDKPAPFYWLLGGFSALPVGAETAARLPAALATLATALLLHRFARPRFGRRAALLGGAIYLTSPAVVALGRFCNPDAVLTAAVTAATLAWLRWLDEAGPAATSDPSVPPQSGAARLAAPILPYAAMGLGALAKGPVAIALPLLIAVACAARRGALAERLRRARPLRGLALSALIGLAWLLPAGIAEPAYVRAFLVDHNVMRWATGEVGHARPTWFFVPVLIGLLFPWSLAIAALLPARRPAAGTPGEPGRDGDSAPPGAPPGTLRPAAKAPDAALAAASCGVETDLLVWAAIVVAFFSFGRAKLATYVLPALPPLGLWIGIRLAHLAGRAETWGRSATAAHLEPSRGDGRDLSGPAQRMRAALVVWAALLAAAPLAAWVYLSRQVPSLEAGVVLVAPLPVLAALGLRVAWRRPLALGGAPLVFAATNGLIALVAYLAAAPLASRVSSDAGIARLARQLAPGAEIASFGIEPGSLFFYAQNPVRRVVIANDVFAAADRGPVLVVTSRKYEPLLRAVGLALYPWTACERHCLLATVPRPALADRGGGRGAADDAS